MSIPLTSICRIFWEVSSSLLYVQVLLIVSKSLSHIIKCSKYNTWLISSWVQLLSCLPRVIDILLLNASLAMEILILISLIQYTSLVKTSPRYHIYFSSTLKIILRNQGIEHKYPTINIDLVISTVHSELRNKNQNFPLSDPRGLISHVNFTLGWFFMLLITAELF